MTPELPVDAIRKDYQTALERGNVVVAAATGSGKSTRLPLWSRRVGPVLVVEPRRLACTALADYVAGLAGTEPGEGVGYAIRFDQAFTPETEILFVTPGVALRWLEADGLERFATVILDEFHERRHDTDLLAAILRKQGRHRLVMTSATLAAGRLADYLDGQHLEAEGRSYPVEVHYRESQRRAMPTAKDLEKRIRAAVRESLAEADGDLLVFLPGRGEIRACEHALKALDARVIPLHAGVSRELQREALRAGGHERRVILATNVAETSLTIPGITTVIDSGLERRTAQRNGRTVLSLKPVSRANAEQRRGRAGRVAPGRCIRLWGDLAPLEEFTPPEVQREQLTELVLAAAAAGHDVDELGFPDPLPPQALTRARERLEAMQALDERGRITAHGRALFSLPIDSLFAHLITAMPDAATRGAMVDLCAVLQTRPRVLHLPTGEHERKRLQEWEPQACDAWTLVAALRRSPPEGLKIHSGARREARQLASNMRARLNLGDIPEGMDLDRSEWVRAMLRAAPELAFVRREKRPQAMGNGTMEVLIGEDSRLEDSMGAALVLDDHSVPARKGTRKTLTVATCLVPVSLAELAKAGIGELRLGDARMESGRPVAVRERVHAGRVIATEEYSPRDADLRETLARLIVEDRCLKPAGERLRHDLAQWALYLALGRSDGEAVDARDWLQERLAELGVEEAEDLALVEAEDLRFPGIPEWERPEFERQYPAVVSLHDLVMDARYEPRRKRVLLEHREGTRKAEPRRWELPNWQGWKVVYKRGSRVVDVR